MKNHEMHLRPIRTCGCLVFLGCLIASSPARAQEKSAEQRRADAVQRELKRLPEDERREQGRRDYQAVVTRAERTAQITDELLAATQAYAKRGETLLRSDEGKKLGADPVSRTAYVDLLDHPTVTVEEVRAKRAALTSTLEVLKTQEEMVAEGHRISDQIQDDVQQNYFWANDAQSRFTAQQNKLDTILAKAPPVVDLGSAIFLDEAIRNHRTRMTQLSAQAQVAGQQIASDSTRQILVDASVLAELKEAQAKALQLIAESQAKADQQKLDSDSRIAELQKTIDTEQARMRVEEADRAAELKRREEEAAANRFAKDVDSKLGRDSTVSDAEKKLLVKRCQEPRVQQILAPFLAKGYTRPAFGRGGYVYADRYDTAQPVPISMQSLQEVGALSPTGTGCDALFWVAANIDDTMRPRWPAVRYGWREDARTRDLVPEAQKMLIELGPTLVELGLLQP